MKSGGFVLHNSEYHFLPEYKASYVQTVSHWGYRWTNASSVLRMIGIRKYKFDQFDQFKDTLASIETDAMDYVEWDSHKLISSPGVGQGSIDLYRCGYRYDTYQASGHLDGSLDASVCEIALNYGGLTVHVKAGEGDWIPNSNTSTSAIRETLFTCTKKNEHDGIRLNDENRPRCKEQGVNVRDPYDCYDWGSDLYDAGTCKDAQRKLLHADEIYMPVYEHVFPESEWDTLLRIDDSCPYESVNGVDISKNTCDDVSVGGKYRSLVPFDRLAGHYCITEPAKVTPITEISHMILDEDSNVQTGGSISHTSMRL